MARSRKSVPPPKDQRDDRNTLSVEHGASLLVSAIVALPGVALATKPCLPSPCEARGEPDYDKCRSVAAWVAVGTISEVVHHVPGDPLHKDFAEFTFTVRSWEKGVEPSTQRMQFQVGWCESPMPLPAQTEGLFRFYGAAASSDPTVKREDLYFQWLSEQ